MTYLCLSYELMLQLNQNTHYIDASNVYGSDTVTAAELRLFKRGQLLSQKVGKEEYCPQDPTKIFKNGNETETVLAFLAGNRKCIKTL